MLARVIPLLFMQRSVSSGRCLVELVYLPGDYVLNLKVPADKEFVKINSVRISYLLFVIQLGLLYCIR
jgi:hypothetical protein